MKSTPKTNKPTSKQNGSKTNKASTSSTSPKSEKTPKSPRSPDVSVERRPIHMSTNNTRNFVKSFMSGTNEYKQLLGDECTLVFECKVCRSLFRSVACYLSHKRIYCREKFCDTTFELHNNLSTERNIVYVYPEPVDTKHDNSAVKNEPVDTTNPWHVRNGDPCSSNMEFHETETTMGPVHESIRQQTDPSKRTKLGSIVQQLAQNAGTTVRSSELYETVERQVIHRRKARKEQVIHIEKIRNTTNAVYQTVVQKSPLKPMIIPELMSSQISSLYKKSHKEATLDPDGKIIQRPSTSKAVAPSEQPNTNDVKELVTVNGPSTSGIISDDFGPSTSGVNKTKHSPSTSSANKDKHGPSTSGINKDKYAPSTSGVNKDQDFKKSNLKGSRAACIVCKSKFTSKVQLSEHVKAFHLNYHMEYYCPMCRKPFRSSWAVQRHMYTFHKRSTEEVREVRKKIMSKCAMVKTVDIPKKSSGSVTKHSGTQSNLSSPLRTELLRQEEQRNNERAWIENIEGDADLQMCSGCGRKFDRRAALASHSHMCQKRIALQNSVNSPKLQCSVNLSRVQSTSKPVLLPKPILAIKQEIADGKRPVDDNMDDHIIGILDFIKKEDESDEVGTRAASPAPPSFSPAPRSFSPAPHSFSPAPRSFSPAPRSFSPAPRSLSPVPCSLSPAPRSLSPVPRSLSPVPLSSSPVPRSLSPIARSLSPIRALSPALRALSSAACALSSAARAVSPSARSLPPTCASPVFTGSPFSRIRHYSYSCESPKSKIEIQVRKSYLKDGCSVSNPPTPITVMNIEDDNVFSDVSCKYEGEDSDENISERENISEKEYEYSNIDPDLSSSTNVSQCEQFEVPNVEVVTSNAEVLTSTGNVPSNMIGQFSENVSAFSKEVSASSKEVSTSDKEESETSSEKVSSNVLPISGIKEVSALDEVLAPSKDDELSILTPNDEILTSNVKENIRVSNVPSRESVKRSLNDTFSQENDDNSNYNVTGSHKRLRSEEIEMEIIEVLVSTPENNDEAGTENNDEAGTENNDEAGGSNIAEKNDEAIGSSILENNDEESSSSITAEIAPTRSPPRKKVRKSNSFFSPVMMKELLRIVDPDALKCLQCKKSFKHFDKLRRHASSHMKWYRYKCKMCIFKHYSRYSCVRHVIKSHSVKADMATTLIENVEYNEEISPPLETVETNNALNGVENEVKTSHSVTEIELNGPEETIELNDAEDVTEINNSDIMLSESVNTVVPNKSKKVTEAEHCTGKTTDLNVRLIDTPNVTSNTSDDLTITNGHTVSVVHKQVDNSSNGITLNESVESENTQLIKTDTGALMCNESVTSNLSLRDVNYSELQDVATCSSLQNVTEHVSEHNSAEHVTGHSTLIGELEREFLKTINSELEKCCKLLNMKSISKHLPTDLSLESISTNFLIQRIFENQEQLALLAINESGSRISVNHPPKTSKNSNHVTQKSSVCNKSVVTEGVNGFVTFKMNETFVKGYSQVKTKFTDADNNSASEKIFEKKELVDCKENQEKNVSSTSECKTSSLNPVLNHTSENGSNAFFEIKGSSTIYSLSCGKIPIHDALPLHDIFTDSDYEAICRLQDSCDDDSSKEQEFLGFSKHPSISDDQLAHTVYSSSLIQSLELENELPSSSRLSSLRKRPPSRCQSPLPKSRSSLLKNESLLRSQSPVLRSQSPLLKSPFPKNKSFLRSESPVLKSESPSRSRSPVVKSSSPLRSRSPVVRSSSPLRSQSPALKSELPLRTQSPALRSESPFRSQSPTLKSESPLITQSLALRSDSPFRSQSPVLRSSSPLLRSQTQALKNQSALLKHLLLAKDKPLSSRSLPSLSRSQSPSSMTQPCRRSRSPLVKIPSTLLTADLSLVKSASRKQSNDDTDYSDSVYLNGNISDDAESVEFNCEKVSDIKHSSKALNISETVKLKVNLNSSESLNFFLKNKEVDKVQSVPNSPRLSRNGDDNEIDVFTLKSDRQLSIFTNCESEVLTLENTVNEHNSEIEDGDVSNLDCKSVDSEKLTFNCMTEINHVDPELQVKSAATEVTIGDGNDKNVSNSDNLNLEVENIDDSILSTKNGTESLALNYHSSEEPSCDSVIPTSINNASESFVEMGNSCIKSETLAETIDENSRSDTISQDSASLEDESQNFVLGENSPNKTSDNEQEKRPVRTRKKIKNKDFVYDSFGKKSPKSKIQDNADTNDTSTPPKLSKVEAISTEDAVITEREKSADI